MSQQHVEMTSYILWFHRICDVANLLFDELLREEDKYSVACKLPETSLRCDIEALCTEDG